VTTTVTVRAPAKINLHLGVGAPREDGFHPLVTVYQAVGLCDDVTVAPSPGWSLGVSVPDWIDVDSVPVTGDNIVDRAARLLAEHHGIASQASVSITKAIPVAGGMAGGSADAAAALVALDRLWQLQTADDDLLMLAARLGSDVPFALVGGTALGTGRGELVEPVPDPATWWWVAVPSQRGLSTPAVYRRFDELTPDAPEEPLEARAVLLALSTGDPRSSRARSTTTSRAPPSTCVPTSATCWSWASAAARCAAWCPARDPPACSSPRTPTRRAGSPADCRSTTTSSLSPTARWPVRTW